MSKDFINIPPHFESPDDFYNIFVETHESLDDKQSEQFNLALIFMLANHIGNRDELKKLLAEAAKFARSCS